MRKSDTQFAALAHDQTFKSKMHHKIGSVLVCGKQVIGTGFNKLTGYGSGIRYSNKWSLHAEMKILHFVFDATKAKGLTLYVVRRGYKLARPCPHCQQLLSKSSISRIVYSIDGTLEELFL